MRPQFRHALLHLVQFADMRVVAAPDLGGLAHEPGIGRRSDPDGEQARLAQVVGNSGQQFLFVANAAIGDKNDLPQQPRLLREAECSLQRGPHPGASVRLQAVDIVSGEPEVHEGGRHGLREQQIGMRIELHHVECVGIFQLGQSPDQCRPGLPDGFAFHRAGGVDDEYHFPGLGM